MALNYLSGMVPEQVVRTHLPLTRAPEVGYVIISILEVGKLRHREVK